MLFVQDADVGTPNGDTLLLAAFVEANPTSQSDVPVGDAPLVWFNVVGNGAF